MANPVKAARKEGRKMVKEARQSGRAAKVTAKYAAKTEKIKSKNAAPAASVAPAAKSKETLKRPDAVTRLEPKRTAALETKKAEIVKGAPMAAPKAKSAAAPKKSSSAKKSGSTKSSASGPYKGDYKGGKKPTAPKSTVKKGLYDGVANPKKKIGDYTIGEVVEGTKNTAKAAAADAISKMMNLNREIIDRGKKGAKNFAKSKIDPFGTGMGEALLGKKTGGSMKPSYKKGGYMMSIKKKKK